MKNYFNKEDIEKVELLNAGMGTKHRTKPYDFKNASDLNDVFCLSACEYLDYKEYWGILNEVDENFDESIENYNTTDWINMSIGKDVEDKLLIQANKNLRKTVDTFYKLFNRAEQKCREILKIILKSDNNIQCKILGFHYIYDEYLIEKVFNGDSIFELEYIYSMEDTYESFIKYINKTLQEV